MITYLKNKKKRLGSQYQQVAKQLEFTYCFFQGKMMSTLYRDTNEIDLVREKLNLLIQKSLPTNLVHGGSRVDSELSLNSSMKVVDTSYKAEFDWTRGRFCGETQQIIVRKGIIMEKTFLTPKGNRISVKRGELGFLARLSTL